MTRRTKYELYGEIISLTSGGAKLTNICIKANLNSKSVVIHLKRLIDLGFIECCDGVYKSTDSGKEYRRLLKMLLI